MTGSRRAVVTGCAGFIGSHLSELLVSDGWDVTGIDCFTPYYPRPAKEANLLDLAAEAAFDFVEGDLTELDLHEIVDGADCVFHLAAQAGVRGSFGETFADYARDNLLATQRVFEAARETGCRRVAWASSSSVYGDAEAYPCVEDVTPTQPRSPYGVTKRACEDLAEVYRRLGLSITGLRYFTVYGPRQRPDMAMRRICDTLTFGGSFPMFGDGAQSRDFTYVTDACEATYRAALAADPAPIYNVGGGEEASLARVIEILEDLAGRRLVLDRGPDQKGDVRRTAADVTLARTTLGWRPRTRLVHGLARELAWVEQTRSALVRVA